MTRSSFGRSIGVKCPLSVSNFLGGKVQKNCHAHRILPKPPADESEYLCASCLRELPTDCYSTLVMAESTG